MGFPFCTFRSLLSVALALLSLVTMALSFCLVKDIIHRPTAIVMILIEAGSMTRALGPTMLRYWFKSTQSVASEIIGLFVLLPFQLIMTIVITTVFIDTESPTVMDNTIYALRILIFANASIHIIYTFLLATVILLTMRAFDKEVFYRDIDSRPSPFPMTVLGSFICLIICPCFGKRPSRDIQEFEDSDANNTTPCQCASECNCAAKSLYQPPLMSDRAQTASQRSSLSRVEGPQCDPRTLVRVPDAIERRSSIMIAFEV